MLGTPLILGISMASQKSRRILVALTYVILALLLAVIYVMEPPSEYIFYGAGLAIAMLASRWIFGRLIKECTMPEIRVGKVTSLGLLPGGRDKSHSDEREVAIRNAAHFEAYRVLAFCSVIVWFIMPAIFDLGGSSAIKVAKLITMTLIALVFTLPQATILWTERDVPEEARI